MDIGIILPNTGPMATRDAIFAVADTAEELGFASLWTADHLAMPDDLKSVYPYGRGRVGKMSANYRVVEPLLTLAAVAGRTQRIKLGVSIYIIPFRHPLVNAKTIASLDHLASGRIIMGVGLGWIEEEYEALGVPWKDRGPILDDQIRYLRELWDNDHPDYRGEFYRFSGMGFEPKPDQGRVPLWIGGNSSFAMRRAAALGDGLHMIDLTPLELAEHISRLHEICDRTGRPTSEVSLSIRSTIRITQTRASQDERAIPLIGTIDQIVDDLQQFQHLGVQHVALWPPATEMDAPSYLENIKVVGNEILPHFS